MKVFKINKDASVPEFATEGSACFDLQACLTVGARIKAYSPHNKQMELPVKMANDGRPSLTLHPEFRTLVPTGLVFDVPLGHVLKAYPRSGMSVKYGIRLANCTGIIDSDYVEETFITIMNDSDTPIQIYHGDRLAQAMLEKTVPYTLEEVDTKPEQKTERAGGFGSTGTEAPARRKPGPKPKIKQEEITE